MASPQHAEHYSLGLFLFCCQVSSLLGEQYQVLCEKVEQMRLGISIENNSSNSSSHNMSASPSNSRTQSSSSDVKRLQDQVLDTVFHAMQTVMSHPHCVF
jgi:hypothetical protein